MEDDMIHYSHCRGCRSPKLSKVLDFGDVPLVNSFSIEDQPKYPLKFYFCHECGLVQMLDLVPPDMIYTDYQYFTSASPPMVEHFRELAETLRSKIELSKETRICDIGCNDGTFLSNFPECDCYGIDPDENIKHLCEEKGITLINDFLNDEVVNQYSASFDVVFASNTLAQCSDLRETIQMMIWLLKPDGLLIIEVPRLKNIIETNCFDQMYHEHTCHFSILSLMELLKPNHYQLQKIKVHGESFRIFIRREEFAFTHTDELLKEEQDLGLYEYQTYRDFDKYIQAYKKQLDVFMHDIKFKGSIVGYGAPAKSTLFLNCMGLDHNMIEYVIDSTPCKVGSYIPGTRIPIKKPEQLYEDIERNNVPRYVMVFAWNYLDYILEKEKKYFDREHVNVIRLFPRPEIITY